MNSAIDQTLADPPTFTTERLGKHCLVTGGAGYVGSTIVRRLAAAGCKVRSVDALTHDHEDANIACIQADLRDADALSTACEGINSVFHTAAIIKPLEIYRPAIKRLVYDVNVTGTQNLLRAAAANGVQTFVHTSSFNVVLDRELNNSDETLPYATKSKDLYTLTKIAAEKAVLSANTIDGMKTCALRPGGIWGPDTHSIMIRSLLDEVAKNNFKVLIGDGSATIDNTHVDNLVDAQLMAATALRSKPETVAGQAYFITDNEPVNGMEWFRPIVEGIGDEFPTFRLPGGLMKFVGRMMEVIHFLGGPEPTLNRRGIRNLTESSSFRIDKARAHLGYNPRYQRANGIPALLPAARSYVDNLRSGN